MEDKDNHYRPQSSQLPELDPMDSSSLDPGKMLNDTVVEFYMDYLLKKKSHKNNFHLFNTFFYNKIKNVAKICQNKNTTEFFTQTARRWDRNVKLFDKDYLVIPICDSHHWLLVIVCFPASVPPVDSPFKRADPSKPKAYLIIFDSLGYKYMTKFTEPIRNFLYYRWRHERPNEVCRNFRDRNAFQDIRALVPRQINTFDCGIYLLHSFEKFISEPLPSYLAIRANRSLSEWVPNTTLKRAQIKSLMTAKTKTEYIVI